MFEALKFDYIKIDWEYSKLAIYHIIWSWNPVSILYKSIVGQCRSVSYPDRPITARYRFIKNAIWEVSSQIKHRPKKVTCISPISAPEKCSQTSSISTVILIFKYKCQETRDKDVVKSNTKMTDVENFQLNVFCKRLLIINALHPSNTQGFKMFINM